MLMVFCCGSKAETDLILPLIKQCPSSLDAVDSEGVTPRMLAASIKNRLQEQYLEVKSLYYTSCVNPS